MHGGNPQNSGMLGMPPERPGYVTAICVVYIILGGLGIVTSCLGIIGVVFVLAMQNNAEVRDAMAAQGQADPLAMLVNGIFIVMNLFVAATLVLYAIFGLQNKESGRKGLVMISVVAGGFVLLRMIVGSLVVFILPAALPPGMDETERQLAQGIQIGSVVVGVVIALALAGFYFFNASYMKRENIVNFFARSEARLSR
jgi:hypothetical protein